MLISRFFPSNEVKSGEAIQSTLIPTAAMVADHDKPHKAAKNAHEDGDEHRSLSPMVRLTGSSERVQTPGIQSAARTMKVAPQSMTNRPAMANRPGMPDGATLEP